MTRSIEDDLAEALRKINATASPAPFRTFDTAIQCLDWIAAEARLALSRYSASKQKGEAS